MPLPSAGGPYSTAEGDDVTLSAIGPEGTYTWDVNGDGIYGDATGASPTLTREQLHALGLGDGQPDARVRVQVADAISATVRLHVDNRAPTAAITGPSTVPASGAVTLSLRGDDVPEDDLLLVVDWGDGNSEILSGARERTASHTYAAPGAFVATLVVRDDDGGQSAPARHLLAVASAPVPLARPAPSPVAQSIADLSVSPRCSRAPAVRVALARTVLVRFRLATAGAVQLTLERRRDRPRCHRDRSGPYARSAPGRSPATQASRPLPSTGGCDPAPTG